MCLFLLVLFIVIGLTIWFVFISEAPIIARILVGALFIISFFLHLSICPSAGFFLRIAIGIFVMFYRMHQLAKLQ